MRILSMADQTSLEQLYFPPLQLAIFPYLHNKILLCFDHLILFPQTVYYPRLIYTYIYIYIYIYIYVYIYIYIYFSICSLDLYNNYMTNTQIVLQYVLKTV